MIYWTLAKISARSAHDSSLTVNVQGGGGSDGYHCRSRGLLSFEASEYQAKEYMPYIPFLVKLPKSHVVVVLDNENKDLLVQTLQNCIVETYDGEKQSQFHFIPLSWYMAAVPFYRRVRELEKYPENGLEAYVNGKLQPFLEVCKGCPCYLDKSVGICKPLHPSCRAANYPFNPKAMVGNKMDDLLKWFDGHPMRVDALRKLPGYEYKVFGQLSVSDAFERSTFDTITTDLKEHQEIFETRSERSLKAAETQRLQRFSHKDCINCQAARASVQYCKGPYYEEDMLWLADACEPWMFHVMSESGKSKDCRKILKGFGNTRIANHRAVCAEEASDNDRSTGLGLTGKRAVRLVRTGKTIVEYFYLSYEEYCRIWELKPVNSWDDISNFKPEDLVAKTGWPIPPYIKATIYCLYKGFLEKIYSRSGWGNTRYDISGVEIYHHGVKLEYQTNRGWNNSRHIHSLTDLRHHEQLLNPK